MREQQELSDDIVNALGQNTQPVDEEDLENDLEALQQESLDEAMLKTGTVPSFPTPAQQERKFDVLDIKQLDILFANFAPFSRVEEERKCRRRRRGGAAQAGGGNGHVAVRLAWLDFPLACFYERVVLRLGA